MNGGIKLAVEMMPSLAPSTAALIHPMRPTRGARNACKDGSSVSPDPHAPVNRRNRQPVTLDVSIILYVLHLIDTEGYQSQDSMSTIRNFQCGIAIAILTSLGMTSRPTSGIAC